MTTKTTYMTLLDELIERTFISKQLDELATCDKVLDGLEHDFSLSPSEDGAKDGSRELPFDAPLILLGPGGDYQKGYTPKSKRN